MEKKLIIIGASGHGRVVADIATLSGYERIKFLDDNDKKMFCGNYKVVGKSEEYKKYKDHDFIVGIGNATIREKIQNMITKDGCNVVTLIHPNAVISGDVEIGIGTVIMAGAVVNSGSTIGDGVIINTCSSVDHDCIVKNFVHVSVGAHIAGTVYVAEKTWIGAGAIIVNNIEISKSCTIGAGAVIIRNINHEGIYVGVPAKKLNNRYLL